MADDTPAPETPKRRRATKAAGAEARPKAATRKAAAPKAKASEAKPARKPRQAAASAPAPEAKTEAAKPKTRRKPRAAAAPAAEKQEAAPKRAPRKAAAPKAAERPRAETPVAAVVEKAVATMKRAVPEAPPRTGIVAALGTAAVVAGAFFVWRASRAEEPRYQTIESDGPIEVRKYPPLVTAGAEHRGERQAALNEGFRTLADYLFAKSRPGKKLPMTAPVLSDTDGDGSWRTRFIMPAGKARAELPAAPLGVELTSEPARRVAAIRFSGRADDATLAAKEGALRSWLQLRGLPSEGKATHAFYNAPFLPGPMRRNEVMIVLSEEGGTGA
jgi:hypothetical protein